MVQSYVVESNVVIEGHMDSGMHRNDGTGQTSWSPFYLLADLSPAFFLSPVICSLSPASLNLAMALFVFFT